MKKLTYILLLCLTALLPACNEEEIAPYSDALGINFLAWDSYGQPVDNYQNLTTKVNFYNYYAAKGMAFTDTTTKVCVQLEGIIPDHPVNVRLRVVEDEGYPLADVILPGDSAIAAGEYRRTITLGIRKPEVADTEYRAILTFDYENSDVVPGTKERQQYTLILTDETDWESMYVDNADEWNSYYAATLGTFGPVKARFILVAMGEAGYSADNVKTIYNLTQMMPSYSFGRYMSILTSALDEWNSTHDTPLAEADGTPVSVPNN